MTGVLTAPIPEAAPDRKFRVPRWRALLRRHRVLAALLAAGAVLRLLTALAYSPAILYFDSLRYLDNLETLRPDGLNPIGYELILSALLAVADLRFVVIVQHLLGLAMAVAIYALLLRHGARRWLAAAATAPMLLDAYQVQIEQNIMSDVWFQALLLGIVVVLTWRGQPSPRHAAIAGLLVGVAVLVRMVGITLLVPAIAYLIVAGSRWDSREGWRRIGLRAAAMTAGFVVVMASYAGYYRAASGQWGLTGAAGGAVTYGRAAAIADCTQIPLGSWERLICPREPRDAREGVDWYIHSGDAPAKTINLPASEAMGQVQGDLAWQVFANQPVDLAGAIAVDFLKGFRPVRTDAEDDVPVDRWHFGTSYPYFLNEMAVRAEALQHGDVPLEVNEPLARFLRGYQLSVGYTPGPLLGLALLAGAAGGLGLGRARRSGIRAASLLASGMGATVLVTAAAFEFSWRYQLPGLVLLPMAGVLGVTAFTGPLRRPGPRLKLRPPLPPYPDEVDVASVRAFVRKEGDVRFAPVVVVIAAYNEEDGIGEVLDAVPSSCCGLPVDTLVVVDGSTDGTAEVARSRGARVCEAAANRGQGAALRLGYALARRGGARYVVTTDADGQYDIDELPLLLRPLIHDEADFVTGSRVLGRQETADPVRHLGVHVFARLASLLTRRALTDTSFGFRAMRAEVTATVTLAQAQYQASELLVGVISHGYRVLEQPMTIRARSAGETKKGNNFVYGMRYARVLVGTWWRERSSRRVTAPNTSRSSSTNLTTKSSR
ncbi:MAG: glycosyltransferase [Actinomycetota bacterium]|nr:glycosyltransferase [Actinomycetota bacterium]